MWALFFFFVVRCFFLFFFFRRKNSIPIMQQEEIPKDSSIRSKKEGLWYEANVHLFFSNRSKSIGLSKCFFWKYFPLKVVSKRKQDTMKDLVWFNLEYQWEKNLGIQPAPAYLHSASNEFFFYIFFLIFNSFSTDKIENIPIVEILNPIEMKFNPKKKIIKFHQISIDIW